MTDPLSGFTIQPYDLPDAELLKHSRTPADSIIFVPPRLMAVIGRGSVPEQELNLQILQAEGVPVCRRATGGCAVVLSPEMMCAAFAVRNPNQRKSSEYFQMYNALLIRVLERLGVVGLRMAGTSDIALKDRKLAGTAIYRNRDLVFYHAVINVAADPELIHRYLLFPPRQPDYRANRSHRDFVTSLKAEGYTLDLARFSTEVKSEFSELHAGAHYA